MRSPIVADEREHSMLDGIPLGCAGRIVTHLDPEIVPIAQDRLQLQFPLASSITIASSAIGEDKQSAGVRIVK
jgi:hypothetical protein